MTRLRRGAVFCTLLSLLAACGDPIVGASCRPGFREALGRCVPVIMDAGVDAGPRDADVPDADAEVPRDGAMDGSTTDGEAPRDGATPDAGTLDSGAPDGAVVGCGVGETLCGEECVRPNRDSRHCGGCDMPCDASELCVGGTCEPGCDPPLTMCGRLCIDLSATTDPDNCGFCGRRCDSGICLDGTCVEPRAGHVVAVGHDYRNSRVGMNRVAGNAVFLGSGSPVQVLAWEGDASPSSVTGVDRAIDQVATDRGRSWNKFLGERAEVSFLLGNADVFLIYPQRDSSDDLLLGLGTEWAAALSEFVRRGGVIVFFEGLGGNDGTWQILDSAGLFEAAGRVNVSGDTLRVVSAGDAVAVGVPLTYRGETTSVRFETSQGTVVVEHPAGPVVIHRVVEP